MQAKLIAGDSLKFLSTVPDYTSTAGYTLTYRLVRRDGAAGPILITASAEGDGYAVNVTPATTATWTVGQYTWAAYVTKTGERYTVETGEIEILPDAAVSGAPLDIRSQAVTALAAAKTAFAAWDGTRKTVAINGRSVTFNTPSEIMEVISHWEVEVQRERDAQALNNGLRSRRNVYVRFRNV